MSRFLKTGLLLCVICAAVNTLFAGIGKMLLDPVITPNEYKKLDKAEKVKFLEKLSDAKNKKLSEVRKLKDPSKINKAQDQYFDDLRVTLQWLIKLDDAYSKKISSEWRTEIWHYENAYNLNNQIVQASPDKLMKRLSRSFDFRSISTANILSCYLYQAKYEQTHLLTGKAFGASIARNLNDPELERVIFTILKESKNTKAVVGFAEGFCSRHIFYDEKATNRINLITKKLIALSKLYDKQTKDAVVVQINNLKHKLAKSKDREAKKTAMMLKMSVTSLETSFVVNSLKQNKEASKKYEKSIDKYFKHLDAYLHHLDFLCDDKSVVDDLKKRVAELKEKNTIISRKGQSKEADAKAKALMDQLKKKYDKPESLVNPEELDYISASSFDNNIILHGAWDAGILQVLERAEHYFDAGKCHVKLYRKPYFNSSGDTIRIFDVVIPFEGKHPTSVYVYKKIKRYENLRNTGLDIKKLEKKPRSLGIQIISEKTKKEKSTED